MSNSKHVLELDASKYIKVLEEAMEVTKRFEKLLDENEKVEINFYLKDDWVKASSRETFIEKLQKKIDENQPND